MKKKTESKKEPKTRTVKGVDLPSGFWEIVKETPEGVTLVNKKGHRQTLTLEQLARLEQRESRIKIK